MKVKGLLFLWVLLVGSILAVARTKHPSQTGEQVKPLRLEAGTSVPFRSTRKISKIRNHDTPEFVTAVDIAVNDMVLISRDSPVIVNFSRSEGKRPSIPGAWSLNAEAVYSITGERIPLTGSWGQKGSRESGGDGGPGEILALPLLLLSKGDVPSISKGSLFRGVIEETFIFNPALIEKLSRETKKQDAAAARIHLYSSALERGSGLLHNMAIDDSSIGRFFGNSISPADPETGKYVCIAISPGVHTIRAGKDDELKIKAEAGVDYYVELHSAPTCLQLF